MLLLVWGEYMDIDRYLLPCNKLQPDGVEMIQDNYTTLQNIKQHEFTYFLRHRTVSACMSHFQHQKVSKKQFNAGIPRVPDSVQFGEVQVTDIR